MNLLEITNKEPKSVQCIHSATKVRILDGGLGIVRVDLAAGRRVDSSCLQGFGARTRTFAGFRV